jgi:hypothetical protein
MSCQFTVPPAAPSGQYELCVIANGISSACVTISYNPIIKSPFIDSTLVLKEEFENYGKLVAEGDPWDREDWVINPVIQELASRLETIQSSISQTQSLILSQQLPEVGRQIAQEAFKEVVAAKAQEPKPLPSDEAEAKKK